MIVIKKATHCVAFFIFILSQTLLSKNEPSFKFRGLWVLKSSMISRTSIDSVLSFAQKNRFNHIFFQVRGRGYAFYSSEFVPRSELIKSTNFDPLSYAIFEGHKRDLYIHAWINVFLLWSADTLPNDSTHILITHPDWIDEGLTGNHNRINHQNLNNGNVASVKFLNPSLPEVTQHLLLIFEELLTQYNIDGIHLDYLRYKDLDYGYNPSSLQIFQEKFGVEPPTLMPNSSLFFGDSTPKIQKEIWEKWNKFRQSSVTHFVKKCNALILEKKPSVLLSVAVKANLSEAKSRYFQVWNQWLEDGLVDFVIPMNYSPDLDSFAKNIDLMRKNIPSKYHQGIIMGIAIYNQDTEAAIQKVIYTRGAGFTGISLFSYNSLKDDLQYFLPLLNEILNK